MKTSGIIRKKRKIIRPSVNLNMKLFLIFLVCLIAAMLTFRHFTFNNPQIESVEKEQKEKEKVEKILVQLTHSLQEKHIKSDDIVRIVATITPIKDAHPKLRFLVANAKGDVIFHSHNNKIQSENIKYLLKQKFAAESASDQSSNTGYSSFISLISFQGDLGYLVIEGPPSKFTFNPTKYIHQTYIAFGCSVLVFLILFI